MPTNKECAQIHLDASLGVILRAFSLPPVKYLHAVSLAFPFSAIVGQDEMKLAILVAAGDPRIGGVLVFGDRGTGKSTAVRALDLERALSQVVKAFEPGLLARANRGFLYIDEVNLLEDHLVDLLIDVAASGENVVEREGLSVRHPNQR